MEGSVIALTEGCSGYSYEFEYDNSGNLTNYKRVTGEFGIYETKLEYDTNNRLIQLNDRTYEYFTDSIIVRNVNNQRIEKYWNLDEFGRPQSYTEIVTDPELCATTSNYEYDENGNLTRNEFYPCSYRSIIDNYTYNKDFINPDPLPKSPLEHNNPFISKSKFALVKLISDGGGPSGTELIEEYEFEWKAETSQLYVMRTTSYSTNDTPETELLRIYNLNCP